MDCGPACLAMIARHYGKRYSLQFLRKESFLSREGVSMAGILNAAKKIGLEAVVAKASVSLLRKAVDGTPCILHWNQNHFVVLYKVAKNPFSGQYVYKMADPGYGLISIKERDFLKSWLSDGDTGIVMFLTPAEYFDELKEPVEEKHHVRHLTRYVKQYKYPLLQIFVALLATSLFTLAFPMLTQALIDVGIASKSQHIVLMILLAQVFLFLGSTVIEVVRNWISLYIGTKINIQIISEFLRKILKLPISFFDTKMMGDFSQRIQDHTRIESVITSQSLITIFSLINFLVFFFVLFYYDITIVITYLLLTVIAITWVILFMEKRRLLDYYKFMLRSENQESIYELISGIQEIKLNRFENYKRREWEEIQLKLFRINLRVLRLDQIQVTGFSFINQIKNILVTYIAARAVINGSITLGSMLAVSYIIGQMNSPVNQLISFFRSFQDARLSIERLNEVQSQREEEDGDLVKFQPDRSCIRPGILFRNINFRYGAPSSPLVLQNINLFIPEGKTTAIVGASGSGKTTLMKLLLRFYEPGSGEITVNHVNLNAISPDSWRENCGIVMQDGYIFSDTIERNIACGDESIDQDKLMNAIRIANITDFIMDLPLGIKTKIGSSGNGISGGQKQRILIARSVYKNPHYIFFDEATSALDAENENIIHRNLQSFFKGKTVVIIAHRLSTVKNADNIIVLKKNEIVEQGAHQTLIGNSGEYYNLIRNQLELGK